MHKFIHISYNLHFSLFCYKIGIELYKMGRRCFFLETFAELNQSPKVGQEVIIVINLKIPQLPSKRRLMPGYINNRKKTGEKGIVKIVFPECIPIYVVSHGNCSAVYLRSEIGPADQ